MVITKAYIHTKAFAVLQIHRFQTLSMYRLICSPEKVPVIRCSHFMSVLQVLRNRVQALRGYGISVKERVRGVVQENLVYQGHPTSTKTPIRTNTQNMECVVLNNSLLRPRLDTLTCHRHETLYMQVIGQFHLSIIYNDAPKINFLLIGMFLLPTCFHYRFIQIHIK